MSDDDIERFEEERELELYREYRDVLGMFSFVVETERRFYLANKVDVQPKGEHWVEVQLEDAWVWDMFRPPRAAGRVDDGDRQLRPADVHREDRHGASR